MSKQIISNRNIPCTGLAKKLSPIIGLFLMLTISCEDFVDIDPPNNQLTGSIVFDDANDLGAVFLA